MEIKACYGHTKYGNFMFNLCKKGTLFLSKHRFLYYLLACTWGLVLTVFGLIVTFGLWIASLFNKNIKFNKYGWIYCCKAGPDYWGGFETGLMFVRDQRSSELHINSHEFSHSFQNCILGPFYIFLVAIPSAVRWWARTLFPNKTWSPYDSAWFEDEATQGGLWLAEQLNLNNKK